jgi:5-methylcytosine-specific restriction enzyme A
MALKSLPSRVSLAPRRLRPALGSGPSRDQARNQVVSWRKWYHLKRWKDLALKVKQAALFTCQWPGCGRVEADPGRLVADHIRPHDGDPVLFWNEANLQCLCKACHDGPKQAQDRKGRGGLVL